MSIHTLNPAIAIATSSNLSSPLLDLVLIPLPVGARTIPVVRNPVLDFVSLWLLANKPHLPLHDPRAPLRIQEQSFTFFYVVHRDLIPSVYLG